MCPSLVLHVHMCKTSTVREKSPLVNPRTKKATGVDLRVLPIVYPPRYSPDGGIPMDFVLGCVCLGHRFITNHVCAQDVKRSYPVPPKTGSCTLIMKKWNLRS